MEITSNQGMKGFERYILTVRTSRWITGLKGSHWFSSARVLPCFSSSMKSATLSSVFGREDASAALPLLDTFVCSYRDFLPGGSAAAAVGAGAAAAAAVGAGAGVDVY